MALKLREACRADVGRFSRFSEKRLKKLKKSLKS
jgi:hypothetical protein